MVGAIDPGRLLRDAAKRLLLPLGCRQVGSSRIWIADQRFWVIIIEFQPSSFSKGSYLNVGANWLWCPKDHWSFDYSYRVDGFIEFQDGDQFAGAAEQIAIRAANEVRDLREKLGSLSLIAHEIIPRPEVQAWPVFHAAVVAGLLGNVTGAERYFIRLANEEATTEWHKNLQTDATRLLAKLPDTVAFRNEILALVQQSRALHKLPADPMCLENESLP